MRFGIAGVAICTIMMLNGVSGAQVITVAQVQTAAKGSTVTLAGSAAGWKDSWKQSAPNTFYLTDQTGSVRVCIWPDDLAEAAPGVSDALKKKGALVKLRGEVEIFREKPEIHVKDGAAVSLIGAASAVPAAATSATLAAPAPSAPVK